MEENNVALEPSKQKQFVKSLKGIKKLIKKKDVQDEPEKSVLEKTRQDQTRKRKRKERGLVYLSHIPHGFYEHEMTQYFKQFGVVTNARVIRSKRTGNSKGHAFVEFKQPEVAQIVAETMNNYLMGKRLIKAVYIPPKEQKRYAMRKRWNALNNPGNELRLKMKKAYNSDKDDEGELKKAKKMLSNLSRTKKKLKELGIDYDMFMPVDIPETLINKVIKQETDENNKNIDKSLKNKKKTKNAQKQTVVDSVDKEDQITTKENASNKNKKKSKKIQTVSTENTKKSKSQNVQDSIKTDKHTQKKLNKLNVKPLEDFVAVPNDSDDSSDSSYVFDSDEYEKMINSDDDSNLSFENDDDGDDSNDSESEVNESLEFEEQTAEEDDNKTRPQVLPKPKKNKNKTLPKVLHPVQVKKLATKKEKKTKPQIIKRKADQDVAVTLKKSKFEKRSDRNVNAKKQ